MLDALKSLFEGNSVISEDIKADIENAWNTKIQENREIVTAQLREEFAQRYEYDKQAMVEAVNQMIGDKLAAEISEFTADRRALAEQKAKYAVAMRDHSDKLQNFVLESLAKEISALHDDRNAIGNNFDKLEEFIVSALAKEITDFQNDKKDLAETKVKLVKEAREQFAHIKGKFIKQSASLVEEVVAKSLNHEIATLKEDIDQARQNDFGRKIFEAFTSEYQHSLLNEKSETAKLLKVIAQKDKALAEAKQIVTEKQRIVESKEQEIARTKDMVARKEIMNELLTPLNKEQRSIMSELLESVQTTKLHSSYDKYLPAVLNKKVETKRVLSEGKEITGNKPQNSKDAVATGEVIDIRRLAGL